MDTATSTTAARGTDVRPFTFEMPEDQLTDLRRRLTATK
jgi:hypothetical protein